jgi:hypothetical protein
MPGIARNKSPHDFAKPRLLAVQKTNELLQDDADLDRYHQYDMRLYQATRLYDDKDEMACRLRQETTQPVNPDPRQALCTLPPPKQVIKIGWFYLLNRTVPSKFVLFSSCHDKVDVVSQVTRCHACGPAQRYVNA